MLIFFVPLLSVLMLSISFLAIYFLDYIDDNINNK